MLQIFHIAILLFVPIIIDATDEEGYMLKLEHAFGKGEFHERGEMYFPSIRGEKASMHKQLSLTKQQYLLLQELSKSGGVYKIRVKSKLSTFSSNVDNDDTTWLTSYTYAKLLLDASLCDDISVHTDGLGNVMAINLSPSISGLNLGLDVSEFTTNISVVMPSVASGPDTLGYLNKIEEERRRKEAAAKEPTSFFSKYWMYIIPVVVIMMLQSAAQPQQA